jgi:hypothetical protein
MKIKKTFCIFGIFILGYLLSSCTGKDKSEQSTKDTSQVLPDAIRTLLPDTTRVMKESLLPDTTADYFPLSEGNEWIYKSNLGKYVITVKKGNLPDEYIYISKVKGTKTEAFLVVGSSAIVCRKQKTRIYLYKEESSYKPYLIRYLLPIKKGKKFSWNGTKIRGRKNIISELTGEIDAEKHTVEVPAGEFECLKLHTSYICDDGTQQYFTQWLAPDVGIVKMESKMAGKKIGVLGQMQKIFKINSMDMELTEYTIKNEHENIKD